MIKDMEDIKKCYDKPYSYQWGTLCGHLMRINGNCSVLQEPVIIKLVDKHNVVQFSNSKVYITDNNKSGKDRAMSLVVVLDDNTHA